MSAYRRYCRICWWGGRCWRFAAKGWFQRGSDYATILGAAVIGIIAPRVGAPVTFGNEWPDVVLSSILYTAVAAIALFIFRLVVLAPIAIHRDGHWTGNRFTYNERKLAFHRLISPADNNYAHNFYFLDAPPFSLIHYKIEIDGLKDHISVVVVADHWRRLPDLKDHSFRYGGGSLSVGRERRLWLTTFMRADADPRSVRIYVTGWEITEAPVPDVQTKDPPDYSKLALWSLFR